MAKKEYINFSIFELIQEEKYPSLNDLVNLIGSGRYYENGDGFTYSVTTEKEENLLWISFEYGATHPRPEHVIDRAQENKRVKNPRSADQVEPTKQLFCVYDENEANLYVSNSRKNKFIETFLNDLEPDHPIFVQRVIIEPEEFLAQLKTVDRMVIAAKTDLLSQSGHLFKPVQDIFGMGAPEQFQVTANYGMKIEDKIKTAFRKLFQEYEQSSIQKFICVGKNDKNIETVFNTDTFNKKISIYLYKKENGLFEPTEVKNELLTQLKKMSGENE